jgi:MinD superfamily P-loop ATPase
MEVFGPRVEAADTLLLVTESSTNGLRDVQHVGYIVPAVRVVGCRQVLSEHAWPVLFE